MATASMGVPLVVDHGETGLLSPEEDEDGMRQNLLAHTLGDQALQIKMGRAARQKVLDAHGMAAASARLSEIIADLNIDVLARPTRTDRRRRANRHRKS